MATKTNTAPTQTLAQRKAVLDAEFHAGTKAQRQALMYANGMRAARENKGYGRAAVAKALGITAAEWWLAEFVYATGTPEHKAIAAKVAGLPTLKKVAAPAKGRTNLAKPKATSNQADITDLV